MMNRRCSGSQLVCDMEENKGAQDSPTALVGQL